VLDNKKCMQIAFSAGLKFAGRLSEDEIYNCILHAIWRALDKYDEKQGDCEFTTYLYTVVKLECLNYRQRTVMSKEFPQERGNISRHIDSDYLTDDRVDMLDELETVPDPEIMFDRFYNSMTLQEIAEKNGYRRQNVAQKIGKNLNLLKRRLQSSV